MSDIVHIYAIGHRDGPVKIGVSSSPGGRILGLQTGCPFELSLLYSRPCRSRMFAMDQERIIHEVYDEQRLFGEWFDLDEDRAIEAIDTAIDTALHFEGLS